MSSNLQYRSRAVRAMVLLHEEHLRRFVHTWRLALASSVSLPPTEDPAYASLEALGRHVLSAAGGYMIWMCEVLALPEPGAPSIKLVNGECSSGNLSNSGHFFDV